MNRTTAIETIGPQQATRYLANNGVNRRLVRSRVHMFAEILKAGHFQTTHQGIAFNDKDEIIDGQHRLTAVAETGIPIQVQVTRGIPAAHARSYMVDCGKNRSAEDLTGIPRIRSLPCSRIGGLLITYGAIPGALVEDINQAFDAELTKLVDAVNASQNKTRTGSGLMAGVAIAMAMYPDRQDEILQQYAQFVNLDTHKMWTSVRTLIKFLDTPHGKRATHNFNRALTLALKVFNPDDHEAQRLRSKRGIPAVREIAREVVKQRLKEHHSAFAFE